MPRFAIYAGSLLIGHSDLENGDPPMGVAAGRFLPSPAYSTVQARVAASPDGSQADLQLGVVTADGEEIASDSCVQIVDFSAELGAEGLEVHVLGLEPELFARLFPEQLRDHLAQRGLSSGSGDTA
jgi:hypothetical protein